MIETKVRLDSQVESVLAEINDKTKKAVRRLGNDIRNEAVQSIQAHRSAGRLYDKGEVSFTTKDGKKVKFSTGSSVKHIASRPGFPPNADEGFLHGNIDLGEIKDKSLKVVSGAPYSAALEFGSTTALARPFMVPAAEKARKQFKKWIKNHMRL